MKDHLKVIAIIAGWCALLIGCLSSVTFAAICGMLFMVGLIGCCVAIVYACLLSMVRPHRPYR